MTKITIDNVKAGMVQTRGDTDNIATAREYVEFDVVPGLPTVASIFEDVQHEKSRIASIAAANDRKVDEASVSTKGPYIGARVQEVAFRLGLEAGADLTDGIKHFFDPRFPASYEATRIDCVDNDPDYDSVHHDSCWRIRITHPVMAKHMLALFEEASVPVTKSSEAVKGAKLAEGNTADSLDSYAHFVSGLEGACKRHAIIQPDPHAKVIGY